MQRADFLVKENEKDDRTGSLLLGTVKINREPIQDERYPHVQEAQNPVPAEKLDYFTGIAWCQALLFGSWIEASGKIMKIQKERGKDACKTSSLFVDVHDDVFTNLFKSQLFASNLGKMINGSMLMVKNWQNLLRSFSLDSTSCQGKNR